MVLRELNAHDFATFEASLDSWDTVSMAYELLGLNNFREYLNFLEAGKTVTVLTDGDIPTTVFYAFVDNNIIGKVHIRHRLHSQIERLSGHIGYSIHPDYQRKGHGTEMLRLALNICRQFGLERVLLICDQNNVGSIKVIKKNGGILDCIKIHENNQKMHFWVKI